MLEITNLFLPLLSTGAGSLRQTRKFEWNHSLLASRWIDVVFNLKLFWAEFLAILLHRLVERDMSRPQTMTSHTTFEIWGRTCSVFVFFSFFIGTFTVNWQTILTVLQMIGQTVFHLCRWLVTLFSTSSMIGQTVLHHCNDWSNCFPPLQLLVKLFSTSAMIGQTVFHLCNDWSNCFPPLQMIDQNVFYFCFLLLPWIGQTVFAGL